MKGFIYGERGIGKTTIVTQAADIPEMCGVIFADLEKGTMSVGDRSDIDSVPLSTYEDVSQFMRWLKAHCRARDDGNVERMRELQWQIGLPDRNPPTEYRTFICDTITEIQRLVIYQITGVKPAEQPLEYTPSGVTIPQWGQVLSKMSLFMLAGHDLPMHFLCTAPETMRESGNITQYLPALQGQSREEVQSKFDLVGWYRPLAREVGEGEKKKIQKIRRLYVEPPTNKAYQAKNRFKFTGGYLDDPTMGTLIELMKKGLRT